MPRGATLERLRSWDERMLPRSGYRVPRWLRPLHRLDARCGMFRAGGRQLSLRRRFALILTINGIGMICSHFMVVCDGWGRYASIGGFLLFLVLVGVWLMRGGTTKPAA